MNYWIQELSQTADPSSEFRWRPIGSVVPYNTALEAIETKDNLDEGSNTAYRVVDDDANVIEYSIRTVTQ